MEDYDRGTAYASRAVALPWGNPVYLFRWALPASEQAPALVACAVPVADRHDLHQPGPSGLAGMAVANPSTSRDSDCGSSGRPMVEIAKPIRKRYRNELLPFGGEDANPSTSRDSDSGSSGRPAVEIAKPIRKRYRNELLPFGEDANPSRSGDSDSGSSGRPVVEIAKPIRKRYRNELLPFGEDANPSTSRDSDI
ncbi:hypothetical protein MRX96_051635 [Rhipicephalus microplus]